MLPTHRKVDPVWIPVKRSWTYFHGYCCIISVKVMEIHIIQLANKTTSRQKPDPLTETSH